MPRIRIKTSDGRAWGGETADPQAYAQRLANSLSREVSYAVQMANGTYQPWTDVFPDGKLPHLDQ